MNFDRRLALPHPARLMCLALVLPVATGCSAPQDTPTASRSSTIPAPSPTPKPAPKPGDIRPAPTNPPAEVDPAHRYPGDTAPK
ncbi:hypothetical protein ACFSC3_00150 [Sphingomonas floccifaciens]|uniref:Lipoprotein n=1 Tax=Sphingomonas floccifaciens TaxID=1844115 RepID=A0ABW4N754_9SPHN